MEVRRRARSLFVTVATTVVWNHSAWSDYTANHMSTVQWVKIYNNDTIYFALHAHPTTACTVGYFVLSPGLNSEQRQRYYAALLTAKSTGQLVNVGYGEQAADCYNNRAIVYALSLTE